MSSSPSYLDPVIIPLLRGSTVLDAGCGYGRWCQLARTNYWEAGLERAPTVDGFDAFAPNVEQARASGCYGRVWEQRLPSPLEGRWDTVLACELIEHVEQEDVDDVLEILEAAAGRRIIVSTPNWESLREGHEQVGGFNKFEAHRSYLPREAFRERGYRLYGAGWGNPTNAVVRLGRSLRLAPSLHSVTRRIPALAETLVAVKDFTR